MVAFFFASVGEWLKPAGCNPALSKARWFESNPAHQEKRSFWGCGQVGKVGGLKNLVSLKWYVSSSLTIPTEMYLLVCSYGEIWLDTAVSKTAAEKHLGSSPSKSTKRKEGCMKVGDRVYGVYQEWIEHPDNYFEARPYSGEVIKVEEGKMTVKTKTIGLIEVIIREGDTIFKKN